MGVLREDMPFMSMLEITCRNHRGMRYLRKNTTDARTLHIVEVDPTVLPSGHIECACSADDLVYTDTDQPVYP